MGLCVVLHNAVSCPGNCSLRQAARGISSSVGSTLILGGGRRRFPSMVDRSPNCVGSTLILGGGRRYEEAIRHGHDQGVYARFCSGVQGHDFNHRGWRYRVGAKQLPPKTTCVSHEAQLLRPYDVGADEAARIDGMSLSGQAQNPASHPRSALSKITILGGGRRLPPLRARADLGKQLGAA
jgi:hypothetical protein